MLSEHGLIDLWIEWIFFLIQEYHLYHISGFRLPSTSELEYLEMKYDIIERIPLKHSSTVRSPVITGRESGREVSDRVFRQIMLVYAPEVN